MKCEKTDRAVKELYEQCSGPDAHRALHEHLAGCARCRRRHQDTFALLESIYAIELPYPPSDLTSSVMAGIRRSEEAAPHPLPAMAPGRVLKLSGRGERLKGLDSPSGDPCAVRSEPAAEASHERCKAPDQSRRKDHDMPAGVLAFPGLPPKTPEVRFWAPARVAAAMAALILGVVMFRGLSVDRAKIAALPSSGNEVSGSQATSDQSPCRVYSFSGTFQHHDGLRWNPGSISTRIIDGSRIKVGKGSYMTLHFGTVATYLFGPESLVTVHGDGKRVSLEAGTLSETVKSGNGAFSVITPLGTVTVVGTMFDVKVSENGEASVAVREGLVSVRDRRGIARLISRGQAISIRESGIADKPEGVSLLRPMQEIFIPRVFGAAPEEAKPVKRTPANREAELPEAVRKPIILEKDMKEASTLFDFLW